MSIDAIDEGKKEIVLEFVKNIKDILELKDDINVIFCPQYTSMGKDSLACIEPISMTIEVSMIHLRNMSIEEIKKVVAHEITHKFEYEHNPEFQRRLNDLLASSWKPTFSSGIVIIDGGKDTRNNIQSDTKEIIDITHCNYHQCNEETELTICEHCKGYFCEEHIKPKPPTFPNFDYPEKFYEWKNRENTHPCAPYYDYLIKVEKERIINLQDKFDKMRIYETVKMNKTWKSDKKFKGIEEEKLELDKISPNPEEYEKGIPISDITCNDCNRDLLHSKKEYYFNNETNKKLTICPECFDIRKQKERELKSKYSKDKYKKTKKRIRFNWMRKRRNK